MNIPALKILLDDDKTYLGTTKEIFIKGLSTLFEDFKNLGDTALIVKDGFCNSSECCNCGMNGYRFVGSISRKYIDFIFEIEAEDLNEISHCYVFKTNMESDDLGEHVYIKIYYDDKVAFEKQKNI